MNHITSSFEVLYSQCSLAAEEACSVQAKNDHSTAIQEMRTKLRHEQHEREQEQTHHVAMLRELQQMLGKAEGLNPESSKVS